MYFECTCYAQYLYVPMYALTNKTSLSLSLSFKASIRAILLNLPICRSLASYKNLLC